MTFRIEIDKILIDENGLCPVVIKLAQGQKRKRIKIAVSRPAHFSVTDSTVNVKHPDFNFLAAEIADLKARAHRLILQRVDDIDQFVKLLFLEQKNDANFYDFVNELIYDMEVLMLKHEKNHDLVGRNKIRGNVRVYSNVVAQLKILFPDFYISQFTYDNLMRFRMYQLGLGNKKSTVHIYLRTLKALYNKCVLKYGFENKDPFVGLMDQLSTRASSSRKKYLDKETVAKLEGLKLGKYEQLYLDCFLLQFYFGGCDLIDVYFLRKTAVRKGRVYLERGKTNTGLIIDLKVHEKAAAILEKWQNKSLFLLENRKDVKGYENFRGRYLRKLVKIQKDHEIEVLPLGGNLGSKVMRHTFANLGKNLGIDPDILRELMGHERNEVDNYYKDKFPEKIRDEALFKIIG